MTEPMRGRALALLAIAAIAALAMVIGTYALLRDRIDDNRRRAALAPLLQTLPAAWREDAALHAAGELSDADLLGLRGPTAFYRAQRDGRTIGWLIPATARHGYNDDIALITAVDPNGNVLGTQVLAQRETAGLGDRIMRDKSDWLDQFGNRSLRSPTAGSWYVARDGGKFDQITGATVTSRAVTQAVRDTLVYFEQHRGDFSAEDITHE